MTTLDELRPLSRGGEWLRSKHKLLSCLYFQCPQLEGPWRLQAKENFVSGKKFVPDRSPTVTLEFLWVQGRDSQFCVHLTWAPLPFFLLEEDVICFYTCSKFPQTRGRAFHTYHFIHNNPELASGLHLKWKGTRHSTPICNFRVPANI